MDLVTTVISSIAAAEQFSCCSEETINFTGGLVLGFTIYLLILLEIGVLGFSIKEYVYGNGLADDENEEATSELRRSARMRVPNPRYQHLIASNATIEIYSMENASLIANIMMHFNNKQQQQLHEHGGSHVIINRRSLPKDWETFSDNKMDFKTAAGQFDSSDYTMSSFPNSVPPVR